MRNCFPWRVFGQEKKANLRAISVIWVMIQGMTDVQHALFSGFMLGMAMVLLLEWWRTRR